ncbi:MAG: 50S ribosomal protein L3 [bacterium]|nr:50S ribosomal protein L3 [bacterium]
MQDIFVTKIGMTQAWNTAGKRIAVTRCKAADNLIVASKASDAENTTSLIVGYGKKNLKNMKKPVRSQLAQSGFTIGAQLLRGTKFTATDEATAAPSVGSSISALDVLTVGDVVKVQGTSKGRGFAGGVKRYGFKGGPKTHGQSDRTRAIGSIGAGTTPGRVYKGKRMPGHFGVDVITVSGLVVVHVDPAGKEIWISGPVPGSISSSLRIRKQGEHQAVSLNFAASGVAEPVVEKTDEPKEAVTEAAA